MKTIDCVKKKDAYELEQNIEDDDFVSQIKIKIQEIHHLIKSLANEDKQLVKKFLTESVHEIFLLLDAKQPDQDDITTLPIKRETNLPKEVPDHAQDEQIQDLIADLPSSISDQDLSEESAKTLNEAFIQHCHENTQDSSTNIRTSDYQQNESNSCGIQPLPWSSHEINETVKSDHVGSSGTIDLNIVKNEVNHEADEYSGCKNKDNTPDLPMEIDNAETEDAYSSLMDEIDDIKPKSNIPFMKDGTPDTCTTGSEDVSSLLSFLPQLSPYIKFDPRESSVGENEGYIHLTLERTDGTIQNLKVSATAALSAGESGQIEENRQMKANTGEKQLILIQKDLMNKENNADISDDAHDGAEALVASQATITETVKPNVSTRGRQPKQDNINNASAETLAGTEPLIATQVSLTAPETLDPDVSSPRGRPPKPDKYDSVTLDNGQKVFVCHICKSTVQTQYAMMVHLRTHSGEKPFSCDICGKSFTTKGNLKHHLVRHDNAKPFECKFCKKTFKEKRVLMVHERIHNGERPYKIDYKKEAKHHLVRHDNAKPFESKFLKKTFKEKRVLIVHEQIHNWERPYKMSNQLQTKKRKKHDFNHIASALRAVQSNAMSVRRAAATFGIAKSTLYDKLKEKTPLVAVPRTILSPEEEKAIADWAIHMARIGYGRTRHEIMLTVKKILDDDKRPNPFKENKPGKDWWFGFVKRNPSIRERNPQLLDKERAIISPEKVKRWFDDYKGYILDQIDEPQLLLDPSRLYYADGSGFSMCPKSGKVAQRGTRMVYNLGSSDNTSTQITVLACMSATGHYIKPMIVYPGQRFSYNPLEKFPDAFMGRSDNGWMDSDLFYTWVKDIFIPSVDERGVEKPVVLFVDGHSTHMSMRLSDLCRANKVELYCLLEHASHLIQPCDLRPFHALKEAWRQAVRDYQMKNIGEYVTKHSFAEVFKEAWMKTTTAPNAVNGFREAGLFPLDPSKVLNSLKLEPASIFHAEKQDDLPSTSSGHVTIKTEDSSQPIDQTPGPEPLNQADATEKVDMRGKNVSPVELEHLNLPVAKTSTPKQTRVSMPKAITGNNFREMLLEKDRKKAQDLKAKEDRKLERKKKKEEKRQEKARRKKEREEKKRARQEQRRQKEALKNTTSKEENI